MPNIIELTTHPLHLGLGATAVAEPRFTGELAWYMGYGARHAEDGADGRLVALHTFDGPWSTWEMHPRGEEVVICLSGTLTLHQKSSWDGEVSTVTLGPQQAIINPRGVWHTADVEGTATALFITAGEGTENRGR